MTNYQAQRKRQKTSDINIPQKIQEVETEQNILEAN